MGEVTQTKNGKKEQKKSIAVRVSFGKLEGELIGSALEAYHSTRKETALGVEGDPQKGTKWSLKLLGFAFWRWRNDERVLRPMHEYFPEAVILDGAVQAVRLLLSDPLMKQLLREKAPDEFLKLKDWLCRDETSET